MLDSSFNSPLVLPQYGCPIYVVLIEHIYIVEILLQR